MSDNPLNLTRNQLAEFLPNARAVRAFEQLLKQVGDLIPSDVTTIYRLIDEAQLTGGDATAKAIEALSLASALSSLVKLASTAPSDRVDLSSQLVKLIDQLRMAPLPQQLSLLELADVRQVTPAAGNLLIYNKTLRRWVNALLAAGSANITITNADGSVTLDVSAALAAWAGKTAPAGTVVGTTDSQTLTNKVLTAAQLGGTTDVVGGQLKFPATQVPSTNANTLDDYEEGSWTPSIGGTATYFVQEGYYIKIGKLVYIWGKIVVNVLGTGSTTALSGLPFTSDSSIFSLSNTVNINYYNSLAVNALAIAGFIGSSATGVAFSISTTAGVTTTSVTAPVFGNNARLDFSGVYQAAN